jgi:UDP:flavonoid glycosyltransferase YjiC (YdhE family)
MGTSFLNTGFVFRNCVTAFKDREELGAGITLDNNRPETLRRAVRLMLSVPSYRENSFRIGQTLRNSGTVEEAARWILSCVRQNKREVT